MFLELLRVDELKDLAANKIASGEIAGADMEELLDDVKNLNLLMEWRFKGFRSIYSNIDGDQAVRLITPILDAQQQTHPCHIRRSVHDVMRDQFNENICEKN
jgi:hypothetical protein